MMYQLWMLLRYIIGLVVPATSKDHNAFRIYIFLTAIGLTPGGSSTVHIYTQTIHTTTQLTQTIQRTTQLIWEECWPCPVFASYTLASALQLGKNKEKPQSG